MSYLESIFSLKDKTAVVIGGTGELCGAMAEGLAMAGAEVALVGRNENKAQHRIEKIEKSGGEAYFIKGDVTEKNSIQAILDRVIEKSGKCEILVNGAGINSATPFLEVPEEEFDQIFNTNSKAIFLTSANLLRTSRMAQAVTSISVLLFAITGRPHFYNRFFCLP